ncbi:MAG: hypothetical protein QM784_40205 [Polyangiaceae bacterium]
MSKIAISSCLVGLVMLAAGQASAVQYTKVPVLGRCAPGWGPNGNTITNDCVNRYSTSFGTSAQYREGRICVTAGGYSNPTTSQDLYWQVDYQINNGDYSTAMRISDWLDIYNESGTTGSGFVTTNLIMRGPTGAIQASSPASTSSASGWLLTSDVIVPWAGTVSQVMRLNATRTAGSGQTWVCVVSTYLGV